MKSIGIAILAGIIFLSQSLHAQPVPELQLVLDLTGDQYTTLIAVAEQTDPLPAESVPTAGNYWSLQDPYSPPLPGNLNNLPAWDLGGGIYLLDDLDFDYSAPSESRTGRFRSMEEDSGDSSGTYLFDTNQLWLEITNVVSGLADVNLHNATNQVYAIWSTTNLSLPFSFWRVEMELWPTAAQTNVLPFTVPTLGRQNLFLRAEDWTGVDSNGDGIPDWWIWSYYHNLNEMATNLDAEGNTLLHDYQYGVNPTDVDVDSLPDWWELKYFGNLDQSGTNLDSISIHTLLSDYQNGRDPNVIRFAFNLPLTPVASNSVAGTINPFRGKPSYMTILVDDTNQADAVWQTYSSNMVVNLNAGNGVYNVQVGLRGLPADAQQTWQSQRVSLYSVSLALTVTNPVAGITCSQPLIQVQGFANEPVTGLNYDISNAAGIFTNQAGYVTGRFCDTNLFGFTTNYFQCYDISLTNGLNTITLHATDLAGNAISTNFNVTLDYSDDHTAPRLAIIWPQTGAYISGSQFTLQGQVDDATAKVTASIMDANGKTDAVSGLVERNGQVWLDNLPLSEGTNFLTLTATDAAGNNSTTNVIVIGNDVGLTMLPVPTDQLNQSSVSVAGTVADASYSLTVNGVSATVSGDLTWAADNVPVNPAGMAIFHVEVRDSSNHLIASQTFSQSKPVTVFTASYSNVSHSYRDNNGFPREDDYVSHWTFNSGGNWSDAGFDNGDEYPFEYVPYSYGGSISTNAGSSFGPLWEFSSLNGDFGNGDYAVSLQRSIQSQVMILPQGLAVAGTTNLYLVLVRALEYTNPLGSQAASLPLPPEWLQIQGQTLINSGLTNTDGSVWGATLIQAPAGVNVDVTPTATQVHQYWDYAFDVQVTNVQLKLLTITNGTAIDLSTNMPEFCVGQQIVLSNYFDPPLPTNLQATVKYQWNFQGEHVNQITNLDMFGESSIYTNNPALTTNRVTSLWWYNGGTNLQVSCTCTIGGGSAAAQGHVNIYRPTLSGFTNQSPRSFIVFTNDENVRILSYGDKDSGENSMVWGANINSKYNGRKGLTQIITADWWIEPFPGQTSYHGCADASDFYDPTGSYFATNANSHIIQFQDIPSINIGSYSGEILFTNTLDYIRFKPGTSENDGNIYVTVGIVQWNAHGRYNNLTSTMTDNYTPPATPPDDSDGFPQWNCVKEAQ